jgi:hypothetical protein
MRKTWFALTLAGIVLGGCAGLVATQEVKDLQSATSDLATAVKDADAAQADALAALRREQYRIDVARGTGVGFLADCDAAAVETNRLLDQVAANPYDPAAGDAAFAKLRATMPCGIPGAGIALPLLPLDGSSKAAPSDFAKLDASTLPGAARNLNAYVAALSDIATGESAGKADAARAGAVTAGKGLLAALKIPGPVDAIVDVAVQALNSILAAKRNEETRNFLNAMDPAMPAMMERLGFAARLAVAQAALNRARAANAVATYANAALNGAGMVVPGPPRAATPERMAQYDALLARLDTQNGALLALRGSDPMAAARAFAEAHHALRDLFNDPKAGRAALAKGLADFTAKASALAEALAKAKAAK